MSLPPAVRFVVWSIFCKLKDTAPQRFIVDCVMFKAITLWVTFCEGLVQENQARCAQVRWWGGGVGYGRTMTELSCDWWTYQLIKFEHEKYQFTISDLSDEFTQISKTCLFQTVTERLCYQRGAHRCGIQLAGYPGRNVPWQVIAKAGVTTW